MIKKRLVGLLSHAKKYIGFQVFWQWLALIAQMTAVFSIAELLERVLYGLSDAAIMQRTVLVLLVCIAVRFVCERQAAAASYKASVDVKKSSVRRSTTKCSVSDRHTASRLRLQKSCR